MQISEEITGGVVVIVVAGRIDSNTAGELEAVLPARIEQNPATVVDLAEVAYVSSAGLRVLLKGAKVAKARGVKLALAGLAPSVHEVFVISGFSSIFTIAPDRAAALAAVG